MAPELAGSSPTDSAPRYGPGDLVAGKYLLQRVIGVGGMGSVWLARNVDLDAPVAIKLVRADVAPAGMAERLKREARVEAKLAHHAVVRVFDFGVTGYGDPFIAMEHLEGMSLADALDEEGSVPVIVALRLLLPVIDGLVAAHARGIVHRDVKPDNIFLARGARHVQPKLLDFGVAKLDRWDQNPRITLQGTVIGSPSYMSPEQARALNDVDHRADVWAVCATLFEAVTGSPPFRAESYGAVVRRILDDPVQMPVTSIDVEAALWRILARGLAKDRQERIQSMHDLGTSLARLLLAHGITDDVCGDSLVTTWKLDPAPPATGLSGGLPGPSADLLREVPESLAPTLSSGLAAPSSVPRGRQSHAALAAFAALLLFMLVLSASTRYEARPSGTGGEKPRSAPMAIAARPSGEAPTPTTSAGVAPAPRAAPTSAPSSRERSGAKPGLPVTSTKTAPRPRARVNAPLLLAEHESRAIDESTLELKDPYR
jgi:eukaryotic-like serine/threonine-protein kinase